MSLSRLLQSQLLRIAALLAILLGLPLFLLEGGITPRSTVLAEPADCQSPSLDQFFTVEFAEGEDGIGPPGSSFEVEVNFFFVFAPGGQEIGAQVAQPLELLWNFPEEDGEGFFNQVGEGSYDDNFESLGPFFITGTVPLDAEPGAYPLVVCYRNGGNGEFWWNYGMRGDNPETEPDDSEQIVFIVTAPDDTTEDEDTQPDDEDEDEAADEADEDADEADDSERPLPTPKPTRTPEPTITPFAMATNTQVPPTPIPPTEVPPTQPPLILGVPTTAPQPTLPVQPTTAPQPTAAPQATQAPQPTSAPAATSTSGPGPSPTTPPSPSPSPTQDVLGTVDRPEIFRIVPSPADISGDIDVILTNLGLAGFTLVIVFATAVVFNQTINDNQDTIEPWLHGLIAPFAGIKNGLQGLADTLPIIKTIGWPLLVLGFTVGVYGFLEPGFGFNEKSLIVIGSLLLAAGAITYLTDGAEVFIANQVYGQNAAVRLFPFAIIIAAISVVISRLLSFEPGVIYGFVALAVYLRPPNLTPAQEGRSVWIPAALLLCLSVVCWLALIPLRDAIDGGNDSFLIAFLEGVAVAVFIGGLEGVFFNMLPISFMDGDKVFKWNKLIWALTMGAAALLFWHVLLNDQREYFGALSETTTMVAIIVGGVCLGLTVVTWLFFKLRPKGA